MSVQTKVDMTRNFPAVRWGKSLVSFRPYVESDIPAVPIRAALVFAFHGDGIVLADIRGRGWCVPSGRLEPGEDPESAARREAWEEAGLTLDALAPLGWTVFEEYNGESSSVAINYLANAIQLEPLPAGSESHGIRLATRQELPSCYFIWDELISSVFDFAWEQHNVSAFTDHPSE